MTALEDIYKYILRDIYTYILGYIYRYRDNDIDILNSIVSEMVIGEEGRYCTRASWYSILNPT